jgi:2-oxoglutarate dehydrogenase E2 component (dihydrolipoamide succinyltransferase)
MTAEIRVPVMAESVFEATVGAWLKKPGDAIAAGELVLELETDKVNIEVTSPVAGTIERLMRQTGETVRTGDVLALVAGAQAATSTPAAPQPARSEIATPVAPAPEATPVARNLAVSKGIDITTVKGTGPGGKVTREDVEAHTAPPMRPARPPASPSPAPQPRAAQAMPQPTPPAQGAREERVRLTRRRLTMAHRLSDVHRDAVMTSTFNEVDMSGIADLRRRYREEFKARHGTDLGLMSFFIKATVAGLQAYPVLNSELQGDELVYKRYFDIGIAVAADEGLLVPVVRDADRKSFAEIEKDVAALAGRAKERKLTLEELRGGTFTVTNGGVFGSMLSTPILNPPQVGILGMHRIIERPVAVGGQVVIRPMMYLAVTYDHRVVEGADAVRFLVRVKQLLEDPGRLLVHA